MWKKRTKKDENKMKRMKIRDDSSMTKIKSMFFCLACENRTKKRGRMDEKNEKKDDLKLAWKYRPWFLLSLWKYDEKIWKNVVSV